MKAVKAIVFSIVVLFCTIVCMELYRNYNQSFDKYDYFTLEDIGEGDDDYLTERIGKVSDILEENGLLFFIANKVGTENARQTVEIYCLNEEVKAQLENEYRYEGIYKGLLWGEVEVNFSTDIYEFAYAPEKNEKANFYIINPQDDYSTLPVRGDYLAEMINTGIRYSVELYAIVAVVVISLAVMIMLTMLENYLSGKKNVIKILNGCRVGKMIAANLLGEILAVGTSILLTYILLYSRINELPVSVYIVGLCSIALLIDILLVIAAVVYVNMRLAISNAQSSRKMLLLCHGTQMLLTVVFILVGVIAISDYKNYHEVESFDDVAIEYAAYERTSYNEEQIDENNYQDVYANSLIWNTYASYKDQDGEEHEEVRANRNAEKLLKSIVGDSFTEEIRAVYIPESIIDGYVDEYSNYYSSAKEEYYNTLEGYELIPYKPVNNLVVIDYGLTGEDSILLDDNLVINQSEAPIIYFLPDAYQDIDLTTDMDLIRKGDKNISRVYSRLDVYKSYRDYITSRRFKVAIEMIVLVLIAVLLTGLKIIGLNLEYRANAIEICIKKVTGSSLASRYSLITGLQIISHLLGILITVLINYGGSYRIPAVLIGVASLAGSMLIEIFLITIWENKNCNKILKGGAL